MADPEDAEPDDAGSTKQWVTVLTGLVTRADLLGRGLNNVDIGR